MKLSNMNFCKITALSACLLLSAAPGFASDNTDSSHGGHHPSSPHMTEFHQVMTKMDRDMAAAPMKNIPDFDFVSMMIPHHEGAIGMANVILKYGKDAEIRKMAQSIIDMQEKEIKEMKEWIQKFEQQSKRGN